MAGLLTGAVFRNTVLDPIPRLVLLALADNASTEEGFCWPGVKHLAQKCKLSERTVQRYIRAFEASGYIRIIPNGGRNRTNGYYLSESVILGNVPLVENGDTGDTMTEVTPRHTCHPDGDTSDTIDGDTGVTLIPNRIPIESPFSLSDSASSDAACETTVSLSEPEPDGKEKVPAARKEPGTRKEPAQRKYVYEPDDERLAKFMSARIHKVVPSARLPDAVKERGHAAWANEIRLMREIDRRTYKEIQDLFVWANQHHFWYCNILSPATLRRQWAKLEAQRDRDGKFSHPVSSGPASHATGAALREQRASAKPTADMLERLGRLSGRSTRPGDEQAMPADAGVAGADG